MPKKKRSSVVPTEAFLSHSSRDRKLANEIAQVLRSHNIPVWYSTTNIVGAQQWHDEIGAALNRCDWFILLLSPQSVKSKWVKRELLFALNNDRFEKRIVPVLYRDCDMDLLSWTLSAFQAVNFKNARAEGYRELLKIWGLGYKK